MATENETIKACPWCQQKPRNSWVSDAIRMVSCGFPCCPISTVGMPLVEWNSRYVKQPEKKTEFLDDLIAIDRMMGKLILKVRGMR